MAKPYPFDDTDDPVDWEDMEARLDEYYERRFEQWKEQQ